jgi:pSer/pThr/pTyr-binding forkhead associated (FHA) protein
MSLERIKITIMSGAEDGKIFEFEKPQITLGRHPEDDVYLPDDIRVSRHHARITKESDSYYIEDIGPQSKGSTNGTFVGEKRVVGIINLSPVELILLGSVYLKFESLPG